MHTEPRKQHEWLKTLVGEWTYESECSMEPGKPPEKFAGAETVRSLGDLWVVGESTGQMLGGGTATMMITLGYDPDQERFVGTWVGSMMTHLWIYEGTLDPARGVLTLNTEGPTCTGGPAKFQDVIEIRSNDHRILRSQMLGEDGTWQQIMQANYRRKK
jgi:Protein of unknown function (DUF1579)